MAERKQKRQVARHQQENGNKRRKIEHADDRYDDHGHEIDDSDDSENENLSGLETVPLHAEPKAANVQKSKNQKLYSPSTLPSPSPPPEQYQDESDDLSRGSREYSPEVVLDASSKTFRDRQAEEDDEITKLERRLGMQGKQSKKVLDDGFDELLNGLEDAVDIKKTRKEERQWLENKRRKAAKSDVEEETVLAVEISGDDGELTDASDTNEDERDRDENGEAEFGGFDDNGSELEEDEGIRTAAQHAPSKPVRENPYVAPITSTSPTAKYIPPSRRKAPETDSEVLAKLRRQAQGSLNKLSEANIISIVDEFDKFYQANPRQEVTSVIIDLILDTFSIPSALQNTFIILYAAFLAALYKILGSDFAAELISRLTEAFDKYHSNHDIQGKESLNLVSLLANLFTFGVISSALVFDHIKLLLSDFSEHSAELLLRVIRDCGSQLRSDDPTSLKGIVQMMNDVSAQMTSKGQSINIRTRVMMDAITDLKNNRTRQATNAAGITGEHLTRMRKALGSLNTCQLRGTEPLGINRSDILSSDKKGKWWLVGASWKGHGQNQTSTELPKRLEHTKQISTRPSHDADTIDEEIDIPFLLSQLNLSTPTARSIFVALITATDPPDALARLSKLRLTKRQEPEIARVLLRICRSEAAYNPYYAAVARLLLREKKHKMSFMIALWKFFGQLGETQDEDDATRSDEDDLSSSRDSIPVNEMANIARLYATLICKRTLDLNIIKTLNIGFTKENATLFLEVLFIRIFTNTKMKDEDLVEIFSALEPRLTKSVQYFLDKNVRRTDLITDTKERRRVKHGCRMAEAAFAAVEGGGEDVHDDEYE